MYSCVCEVTTNNSCALVSEHKNPAVPQRDHTVMRRGVTATSRRQHHDPGERGVSQQQADDIGAVFSSPFGSAPENFSASIVTARSSTGEDVMLGADQAELEEKMRQGNRQLMHATLAEAKLEYRNRVVGGNGVLQTTVSHVMERDIF